jgi:predicted small lipoprotein YifL
MIKLVFGVVLLLSCVACGVKGAPQPPLDHPEEVDATSAKKNAKAVQPK